MTKSPIRARSDEVSAEEIISALHDGRRVILEREILDGVHEVTLRFDGETYYCDTPTTLHRHESLEGMRACLDDHQYGVS